MKHNYKNLEIWKRSCVLVTNVYKQTRNFPLSEEFGLKNQLRRAVVSVPSNIAEGCGRNSIKELRQFLSVSVGSICEVETQLILSHELRFIDKADKDALVKEICEIRGKIIRFSKIIG